MTPIGLVFVVVGLFYLIFISKYLLPKKSKRKTLEDDNSIKTFFTEVQINKLSEDKKGATIQELFEEKDLKVEVKRLKRGDEIENNPSPSKILQEKDVLLISGAMDKVRQVIEDNDLSIRSNINEKSFPEEGTKMVEVIIMPRTQLVGKKLKNVNFLKNYQARVLAIRQRGKRKFSNLENLRLKIGDVLLLQTNENGYELLKNDEKNPNAPFLSVRETAVEIPQKKNLYLTCSVVLGVILLASLNILPIVIAAWAGVAILVIFRILSMTDTYQAIDWKVIFLLAGSLSFGAAMKSSGLTQIIAEYLMSFLKDTGGQMMIIATLYLITMVFTEIMSNNAAAALLAPVVIALAQIMGLNTTPLLITVMMAGSASFMTPIGYQTNTMVYSAGNYKFTDFFKVGAPLSLLLWITASILIPIIYPLH
jgi:di/tricarboxylate transporter